MSADLYKFLEELLGLLEKCHPGGYDVSSIKLSTTVINSKGVAKNELCKYGIFKTYDHISLPMTYISINNMNQIKNILNMRDTVIKNKRQISENTIDDIFNLSLAHDVYYVQKNKEEILYLNIDIIKLADKNTKIICDGPDYYLRYKCNGKNEDIRNLKLPCVDALYYYISSDKEYLNIPNTISNNYVTIINNFGVPLRLNQLQYSTYVKIHPCYLFNHKYIKFINDNIIIDYSKYIDDYPELLIVNHKYSQRIIDNHLEIIYGNIENNKLDNYYPLTENVVKTLNGYITSISYKPTSMTNIMNEVEEVKQLVSIFSLPLDIKFRY